MAAKDADPSSRNFAVLTRSVSNYWQLFLTEGLLMMFLGLAALLLPFIAALGAAIVMGVLLVATGFYGFVSALLDDDIPGYRWSLLSSAITFCFGILFFSWPFGGADHLAIALAGFLAADGVTSIAIALEHRRRMAKKWIFLLLAGIVSLAGATFLAWWVPQAESWTLDTIIGIDFLVSGLALTIIALEARTASN